MSQKSPKFDKKNSFVEVRFESNSFKKALVVCKKMSTNELILTFSNSGFVFYIEPKDDKGDVFYGEFNAADLPIYVYRIAYTTGIEVPSYSIKVQLDQLMKLPAFVGSTKKLILHFYFKVRQTGRLSGDCISAVIDQGANRDIDASYYPNSENIKKIFVDNYNGKQPSSKCFAVNFGDFIAMGVGDRIESFEFASLSNGKIRFYTKHYTESIIERNENMKNASEKKSKKYKNDKLWINEYFIDRELAIDNDIEEEQPNLEYGVTILVKEIKLFQPLCKLNPMACVQFYLAKNKPLVIRFPLGDSGYGTFVFNSLENDPMENTPKRTTKKKNKAAKSSTSED